jgi:hypothetical protein
MSFRRRSPWGIIKWRERKSGDGERQREGDILHKDVRQEREERQKITQ